MLKDTTDKSPYSPNWRPGANPCQTCGKAFGGISTRIKTQRFCSSGCANRAPRPTRVAPVGMRRCSVCRLMFQVSCFRQLPNRSTSTACERCYTEPTNAAKPIKSSRPCKNCGLDFMVFAPPSRARKRTYCSGECRSAHMTKPTRKCSTCLSTKPSDDFDYLPCGRSRTSTCRACQEAKRTIRNTGLGYFAPLRNALGRARMVALKTKVPYALSYEEAKSLHGRPCATCGQPGSVLRCLFPEVGFIPGGVDILCWVCARWCNDKLLGMSQQDMVSHARAIVAYQDS